MSFNLAFLISHVVNKIQLLFCLVKRLVHILFTILIRLSMQHFDMKLLHIYILPKAKHMKGKEMKCIFSFSHPFSKFISFKNASKKEYEGSKLLVSPIKRELDE